MSGRPPLAERMRPRSLDDILGQQRWLGAHGALRRAVEKRQLSSMILWGPPGCGKTTLAKVLAASVGGRLQALSAVLSGVKDLRSLIDAPPLARAEGPLILFVDEVHRWNKAQQDALLPHVEAGQLTLIGATTENPSFAINAALRSRLMVARLEPLSTDDVRSLLHRALTDPRGYAGTHPPIDEAVLHAIATAAAGDARRALTDLENLLAAAPPDQPIDLERASQALQRSDLRHDRDGSDHHDVVSAWIKSLRGSDPDAAVYWLARLIHAGEDAAYLARRLMVFAAEDVGNADPRGLQVAVAAAEAVARIGMPEGRIPLAQATTFLACAPKSNASYVAIDAALALVKETGAQPVPLHLRSAPTQELRAEGFGIAYRYPHDHAYGVVQQDYLPTTIKLSAPLYSPKPWGEEKRIAERIAFWRDKLADRGR